jgi:hypothetical protein
MITKTILKKEDYYIQFTGDEMKELKIKAGDKFSWEVKDGGVQLTPFAKVEIEIGDWSRETLEFLIQESCEQDISINEVISNLLESLVEHAK